jgi:hypothetical protein
VTERWRANEEFVVCFSAVTRWSRCPLSIRLHDFADSRTGYNRASVKG